MTVCISAICCDNKHEDPKIIVSSDRMITTELGAPVEYEGTSTKISELTSSCVVLSAGVTTWIEDLVYQTKQAIKNENTLVIREIAEKCANAYIELIQDNIKRLILSTYNMSFEEFKDQQKYNPSFLAEVNQRILSTRQTIESNLVSLIAGIDKNGADIFGINSGNFYPFTSLGYQALGSGQALAESVFVHRGYDTKWDLKKAIITLIEAKKQAEEAQGVGKNTDIVIISKDEIKYLKKETIEELEKIHRELMDKISDTRDEVIKDKLNNLNIL